jgi:hypothetical protein
VTAERFAKMAEVVQDVAPYVDELGVPTQAQIRIGGTRTGTRPELARRRGGASRGRNGDREDERRPDMRHIGIASFSLVVAAAALCAGVEPARAVETSRAVHATVSGWWESDGGYWVKLTGGIDKGYLRGNVSTTGTGMLDWVWSDGPQEFTGSLQIATRHGTLYLSVPDLTADTGFLLYDNFTGHATVTGGTGTFEGASGSIDITGSLTSGPGMGGFVAELSGTIVR